MKAWLYILLFMFCLCVMSFGVILAQSPASCPAGEVVRDIVGAMIALTGFIGAMIVAEKC